MPKETLIALAGGFLSAIAAMALLAGAPGGMIFVYLSPLPLFMVGLGVGSRAIALGVVAGMLMIWVAGGPMAAGIYAVICALPAWLVVRRVVLSQPAADGSVAWPPMGTVLSGLAGLGAGMVLAASLILDRGTTGGLEDLIAGHLNGTVAAIWPNFSDDDRSIVVGLMTPIFPGTMGAVWVFMSIINGALAQAILVRLGRNLRPTPLMDDLTLPDWSSWALVGAAAAALVGSGDVEYVAKNVAIILAVPFFFLGLAVVHALVRRMAASGILLTGFYVILIVFGGAVLVVAGIGVVEQWIGLRRRLKGGGGRQEDG